jgi:hypothetical protein
VRRGQDEVRQKDFLDALEKIVLGPESPLLMSPEALGTLRIYKRSKRL